MIKKRIVSQKLKTLAGSLVILGIVFGTDKLIGYSLIGAGVLVSIISIVRARRMKFLGEDDVNC